MTTELNTLQHYQHSQRRNLGLLALMGGLIVLSLSLDLLTGPGQLSLADVGRTLFGSGEENSRLHIIVWDIRLPTALMALLVGAMLSIAGAEIQTILNNPLAEPFTLGLSSASSFGAALAIVAGASLLPTFGPWLMTLSAFVFALVTALTLYFFTRLRGASSETLILVGIALMFTFNALLSLLQYTATDMQLSQIVFWMMGSLGKSDWTTVTVCAMALGLILPFLLRRSWALTALRMGDDKAAALGVNVPRLRLQVLACASLLAATTVAFVGTIGFVGLVGPHIARMLVGEEQRVFLPMSALCGALLMSLTSLVSKSISSGAIYPVGVITALIGVPFFISLILKVQRRNWA